MATLRFSFGTMGSGKSTVALQIHHNLSSRHLYGLLLTCLDREGNQVTSRLGVAAPAIDVSPDLDIYGLTVRHWPIHYLVCDEAQFYTSAQCDQLARTVDELDIGQRVVDLHDLQRAGRPQAGANRAEALACGLHALPRARQLARRQRRHARPHGLARWRREREEGGQWQRPWGREPGSGVDGVDGTCGVVSRAWGGRAQRRREGGGDVQVRRGRAQQW